MSRVSRERLRSWYVRDHGGQAERASGPVDVALLAELSRRLEADAALIAGA
jgi:hypothetical protein